MLSHVYFSVKTLAWTLFQLLIVGRLLYTLYLSVIGTKICSDYEAQGFRRMTEGSAFPSLERSCSSELVFRDKRGLVFDIGVHELISDKDMEKLKFGTSKRPVVINVRRKA